MKAIILFIGISIMGTCQAKCLAPKICGKLKKQYEISFAKPNNEFAFFRLLEAAKRSLVQECTVPGVPGKIANYRACFQYPEKKGYFSEAEVMRWFDYIQSSSLPEGEEFISKNQFRGTLEGAWIAHFLSEE